MYPFNKNFKDVFNNWQQIRIVVVDPSPERVKVFTDACSISFKMIFAEGFSNSRDFIKDEPLVIKFNCPFLFEKIPFFRVGPNVIFTESSISFIALIFSSKSRKRKNFVS